MKVGRPPKYETPEELQGKIDEYFKKGIKPQKIAIGSGNKKQIITVKAPTITGLILYCGFCDRHSFYVYEKIEKFSYTIKAARSRMEQRYEELLQSGLGAGAIFALKNYGWSDRQDIQHSGSVDFSLKKLIEDANGNIKR